MKKLLGCAGNIWELKWMGVLILLTVMFSIFFNTKVEAALGSITVTNYEGEYIECNNAYYKTKNPVLFTYIREDEDEGVLSVAVSRDGGAHFSDINKLCEDEFILYPETEEEAVVLQFFIYDEALDKFEQLDGGLYYINFTQNADDISVDFECSVYKNDGGYLYLNGTAPVLRVSPSKLAATMISISQGGEEQLINVDKDYELTFNEGEYCLSVYTVNSSGQVTVCEGFPKNFVYDLNPPEEINFYLYGDYGFAGEDKSIITTNKEIKIVVGACDLSSGIESAVIRTKDSESATNQIVFKENYSGEISTELIDNCGNNTGFVKMQQSLIVDFDNPEIIINESGKNGEWIVDIDAADVLSGLKELSVFCDDKLIRKEEYTDQYTDIRRLSLNISEAKNINGIDLKVKAVDNAKNVFESIFQIKIADNTPPQIMVNGCENNGVYKSDVSVGIKIKDDYSDKISSRILMKYIDTNGKGSTYELYPDDDLYFDKEGCYELSISATDEAGNENKSITEFTIDKTSPLISGLELFDGKYLPRFSIKGMLKDMFKDNTFVEYKMYLNGEEYNTEDTIKNPGHYSLCIFAKDRAGNISDDQAEFVVYDISATKAGGLAEQSNAEAVNLNDEKENKKIEIKVSGNDLKEQKDNEFPEKVDIKSQNPDTAINGIHKGEILIYSSICGAMALIALILFLIMKKKKRSKV